MLAICCLTKIHCINNGVWKISKSFYYVIISYVEAKKLTAAKERLTYCILCPHNKLSSSLMIFMVLIFTRWHTHIKIINIIHVNHANYFLYDVCSLA